MPDIQTSTPRAALPPAGTVSEKIKRELDHAKRQMDHWDDQVTAAARRTGRLAPKALRAEALRWCRYYNDAKRRYEHALAQEAKADA